MLIGGRLDSGRTATVLKFNSNSLNNDPVQVQSMVYKRLGHACSVFKSPLHDGRSIAIVAGGWGSGSEKAEVLDFTQDGASWQESNVNFNSVLSDFHNLSKKAFWVMKSL